MSIQKIKKPPALVAVRFMVLPYCRFQNRAKNKKGPCGFIRKSLFGGIARFYQPGLLASPLYHNSIPQFRSDFKFYLQEKYPQPKPEVFFQRKDMMENQENV